MKNFVAISSLLLLSVSAISQDVNVYWGKANPISRTADQWLIGERGENVFACKRARNKVSILKYGLKDLQVEGEYVAIGRDDGQGGKPISNDYKYDDIITLKDVFYISVTKYDKSAKQNSLYIQEIGETGKLTGKLQKLETIDSKSTFNRGAFDLIESVDSTRLLLVDYPPYDKYSGEKFTFTTFDEHLNQDKKFQVELPFKDKNFDLDDITYAKDGNIYMMAKILLDRKDKVKAEASYYYELLSVNPNGDGKVVQYDIKLPEKYIDGIAYKTDDDKDIICSGLYGNTTGTAKGDISGIFFMRLNKTTQQVDATGIKDLDKDFIADLTSERKANKGKGISNDFTLRNFIRKDDGGAVMFAEYRYDYLVTTTTSDGHGGISTRTDHHYVRNNIIAVNINPDGTIKWCANIPKYQHTVNDNGAYSSYMLAIKGKVLTKADDKIFLVYNDNPTNMDAARIASGAKLKTMSNSKKSTAVLVELSDDGQFTKKTLFSNKDNDATIMPSHYLRITNDEFIVPAYNGGFWCCISFSSAKSKLARIEFK